MRSMYQLIWLLLGLQNQNVYSTRWMACNPGTLSNPHWFLDVHLARSRCARRLQGLHVLVLQHFHTKIWLTAHWKWDQCELLTASGLYAVRGILNLEWQLNVALNRLDLLTQNWEYNCCVSRRKKMFKMHSCVSWVDTN